MSLPRFYGTVSAGVEAEDDGSKPVIAVGIKGDALFLTHDKEAWAALNVEDATKLAEQIDAAIDLYARTKRAREEAKSARIAALRETLTELEQ